MPGTRPAQAAGRAGGKGLPGAVREVRECMKVCTTNGLQPTLLEAGLEASVARARATHRVLRVPLHALRPVCPRERSRSSSWREMKVKIGLAMIDKGRCLPWAHATPCIMCEEVCPRRRRPSGSKGRGARPERQGPDPAAAARGPGTLHRLRHLRGQVPVLGRPAIYVSSVGRAGRRRTSCCFPREKGRRDQLPDSSRP